MANEALSNTLAAALNAEVVNQAFDIVRSNRTGVLQTATMGEARMAEEGHKLNWLDFPIDAIGDQSNGAINSSATTLNVDDGSKFRPGMLISAAGSDEVILVTAVSANALTIVRGFGGTTPAAIADNVAITIDSVGREENSLAANDKINQPVTRENFFQTMDTAIEMSRRALATLQRGNTNDLNFQLQLKLEQLATQMDRALIRGRKASQTISGSTHTFTGGLNYWLTQTGAINTNNSGNALTLDHINALNEEIISRGGTTNTIAVGIQKARRLQTLVNASYSSQRLQDFVMDEGSLVRLPSDIPLVGNINQIVVDTNLNDNELIIYDSQYLNIVPMAQGNAEDSGNWRTLDATQNGQDGERARIIGDFGFEIRNSQTHMARLHNIG